MNPHLSKIAFRYRTIPRMGKQMGFGVFFMVLSVFLSRHDPNIIWFIFAAMFALCGLVLFMMGVINGFVDLFRYFWDRNAKKQDATQ